MDSIFILNPSVTAMELIDAINIRLLKAKAITSSFLVYSTQNTDYGCESLEGIFLALDDYIEEIKQLHNSLEKLRKDEKHNV